MWHPCSNYTCPECVGGQCFGGGCKINPLPAENPDDDVVAYIGGGYSKPSFVRNVGTGYTDSWGSATDAARFDTRKDAAKFIREYYGKSIQYTPMRVRVDVRLYN